MFVSCIEEYDPGIKNEHASLLVIEAEITNNPGPQYVTVRKASKLQNPDQKFGVLNCDVKIYDDKNNVFQGLEFGNGIYVVNIEEEYLHNGTAFRMDIVTQDGQLISSEYDTLRVCPEIDSIYYKVENFYHVEPGEAIPGVQFYIDYNGTNSNTHYIKYEAEETWKHQASFPITWILDGRGLYRLEPPDYSKRNCWIIEKVPEFFVMSTANLTENIYHGYSLHHILNTSLKPIHGYSLNIKQLSISEDAYNYYNQLAKNTNNSGGLYDTQPQLVEGNLHNITNPDQLVLGYFSVVGVNTKRISIRNFEGLSLNPDMPCEPQEISLGYLMQDNRNTVYLLNQNFVWYRLSDVCVDCTVIGGDTIKPDYWPF